MKIKITNDCIQCNTCVFTAPEIFIEDPKTGKIKISKKIDLDKLDKKTKEAVLAAQEACPVEAIEIF